MSERIDPGFCEEAGRMTHYNLIRNQLIEHLDAVFGGADDEVQIALLDKLRAVPMDFRLGPDRSEEIKRFRELLQKAILNFTPAP